VIDGPRQCVLDQFTSQQKLQSHVGVPLPPHAPLPFHSQFACAQPLLSARSPQDTSPASLQYPQQYSQSVVGVPMPLHCRSPLWQR
jgi:hypothetical protein